MASYNTIKVFSYGDLTDALNYHLGLSEQEVETLFHPDSYPIFFIQNNFPQMPEVEQLLTRETGVPKSDIIYIDFEG